MACGRAGDGARRGAEPRPRGRALGPAPATGRPRPRDGRRQGPTSAQGDPRSQCRPPAGARHGPRGDPGHHAGAHAGRPRRHRQPPAARPCDRGRRHARPARRPLTAGGQRRAAGGRDAEGADAGGVAPHPQRLRGRVPAPLRPLRHRPAADEHPGARLRGRRVLARPRLGRRARLLPVPRHPGRLRARPGARRRAPRRRADHPALHLRAGHEAPALGGVETRSTFSAWIFLIAPFLRAGGSEASAPRSASSSR